MKRTENFTHAKDTLGPAPLIQQQRSSRATWAWFVWGCFGTGWPHRWRSQSMTTTTMQTRCEKHKQKHVLKQGQTSHNHWSLWSAITIVFHQWHWLSNWRKIPIRSSLSFGETGRYSCPKAIWQWQLLGRNSQLNGYKNSYSLSLELDNLNIVSNTNQYNLYIYNLYIICI